ncbi:transcriptional regulator, LysR family protein [Oleiphilus messinensis]|uniref:Transcriptional regulator, LysR family protein n=1 Tax=Oleiphilus messinensis TaxID=141451 RepID=A0A1Y0ICD9_9GAMM|nr:LysR family transcriptional regulator [Oleiphilus messinensis]ARU57920.1 transcriptional regulator, LysR family protein [Oleiphilus messinensis]
MDIEAVIWFAEVVNAGSFVGAARRIGQPSSNVSRRIAKLEDHLGVKLIQRTTRSLSLTQDGEALLPMARQLTRSQYQITEWKDSLSHEPKGVLRLTAPHSFAREPLTQWLLNYRSKYPLVRIELIHSNDYLDFQDNRLDFAFRQGPLPDSSLIAKRLFSIEYGVFATPTMIRAGSELKEPNDLQRVPLITAGSIGKVFPWRFRNTDMLPKDPALSFEDTAQCIQAAVSGLGFTYASRYEASPFIREGCLEEVLIPFRPTPIGFHMVYPERKHRALKNETFLVAIQEELEKFGVPEGLVS